MRGGIAPLMHTSSWNVLNSDKLAGRRRTEPLTLNLLTTTIVAPPSNASKLQMGFNPAYKGLKCAGSNAQCAPSVWLVED
jgi:hypothetical protein